MDYRPELDFLIKVLQKMNLQALLLDRDSIHSQRPDMGLRKYLNMESLYDQAVRHLQHGFSHNAIYRLSDEFFCHFFFLRLPQTEDTYLFVGPYVTAPVPRERMLEVAERRGLSASRFVFFERCYADIPVLADDSSVFTLLLVLGERLWGPGSAFAFVDLSQFSALPAVEPTLDENISDPEALAMQMQAMEKRYAFENQLIELVSQGLSNRAEHMIRAISAAALDSRLTDPVRNTKNFCIVCNTLLRKAAEKGGVHPVLLDRQSAALARKTEMLLDAAEGTELMQEMVRVYCRLVRQHAVGRYPPLVQKTLTYIDANLAGDLRLQTLSRLHNVSSSYLSALFHREYGKTITACILEKRIESAASLLLTTHLQIQTVAQHCGFSDVNYFSKAFKKLYGMTPKQYRQERSGALWPL